MPEQAHQTVMGAAPARRREERLHTPGALAPPHEVICPSCLQVAALLHQVNAAALSSSGHSLGEAASPFP